MRPCIKCDRLQEDQATRCANCGADLPSPPATGAVPINTLEAVQARLASRERALDEAAAKIAELSRRVDELLKGRAAPRPGASSSPSTPAPAPASGAWGSGALVGLLRRWPRASTTVAALMTAATAYSGLDLGGLLTADDGTPSTAAVGSGPAPVTPPVTLPVTPPGQPSNQPIDVVTKERDAARAQLAAREKELAAATAARDQALARERTARGRAVATPAPQPAAIGFIQFTAPSGINNRSYYPLKSGDAGVSGAWPGARCSLVAWSRTRNGETQRFGVNTGGGACEPTAIAFRKNGDWGGGDVVRIYWERTSP